jgi:hypothetical protein
MHAIRIEEARSGLAINAALLRAEAPQNTAFLWDWLATPRTVPAIHGIWTGPEITASLAEAHHAGPLPLECATVAPQPGEVVLSYLPARVWPGMAEAGLHLGLFYAPGGRMFLPIGWHPVSVVARVAAADIPALAEACRRIREGGACSLMLARAERTAPAALPDAAAAS